VPTKYFLGGLRAYASLRANGSRECAPDDRLSVPTELFNIANR